jgi:catechol 2,3-dioxygenase-like lactoylglutathione lyase family enzyme
MCCRYPRLSSATGGDGRAAYLPLVIRGAHVILYSSDAEADRAFLQDLLGRGQVDAGGGWLILQLPPGEIAVHPAETSGAVELYLVCDDVDATVAELGGRGVTFDGPVTDQGWGRLTTIRLPGGGRVGLYEARHPTAFDL